MSGYKPRMIKENEHILLVVFFFLLQALPHIIAEVSTYKWYKNMRSAHRTSKRTADLKPRRLLDFVSPMAMSGYKPRMIKENEHILLVVFFFLLQALCHNGLCRAFGCCRRRCHILSPKFQLINGIKICEVLIERVSALQI